MLARDWHHDREAVLDAIERALGEPEDVEAPVADTPAPLQDASPPAAPIAPPPPPVAPSTATLEPPWRRLEFVEGTSRKFWQARREDTDVLIAFGRIGTAGQSQRKPFADALQAQAEMDKLVAEKLRKGYSEV